MVKTMTLMIYFYSSVELSNSLKVPVLVDLIKRRTAEHISCLLYTQLLSSHRCIFQT